MSKRPRRGDIVEIDWIDSQQIFMGWSKPSEYIAAAKEPQSYGTAGYWLGRHGGNALVVISIDAANGNVTQAASIPESCIRRLRVLARASKATRKALRR